MDAFNQVFEDMGVKAASMGEVLDQTTGSTVDSKEVSIIYIYPIGG